MSIQYTTAPGFEPKTWVVTYNHKTRAPAPIFILLNLNFQIVKVIKKWAKDNRVAV